MPITNDIGRNEDYGEWGGMFSVVHASRDADGPVVEHIPSARPPANPTSLIPPVSSIP